MNPEQIGKVLKLVKAAWPHSTLGDPADSTRVWRALLEKFTPEQIADALKELAASGREHAPPAGVVLRTIVDRATAAPDFDEVHLEIVAAITGPRRYRPPRDVAATDPYAAPPAEHWSHPTVAAFAEHVWNEWRMAPDSGCGDPGVASAARTFYAQQRDAYRALRTRVSRDASLAVIGAPRRGTLQTLDAVGLLGIRAPVAALPEGGVAP